MENTTSEEPKQISPAAQKLLDKIEKAIRTNDTKLIDAAEILAERCTGITVSGDTAVDVFDVRRIAGEWMILRNARADNFQQHWFRHGFDQGGDCGLKYGLRIGIPTGLALAGLLLFVSPFLYRFFWS